MSQEIFVQLIIQSNPSRQLAEKSKRWSPDRTAALTYLADDPSFSNVTQEAKSVGPRVTANAERVIALDADLIVSGVTRAECLKSLTQAQ